MLTGSRAAYAKDIVDLVEHIVRAELAEMVETVEVRFADDQQGEPAIYVDVFLNDRAPDNLGKRFVETQLAVMSALEAEGETRFPYLATKRPNDQYPEDVFVRSRKRPA
ncbi:hypothetical protein IP69_14300 [Bosea sp. AAP35]|uniref:hypothetical protein n=1 Tax=Bosea sp. AAP35 TaxID=1523417 RepID=UPI0006B8D4F5|nr:hypothetical protein [Bosea sp. AAP35]KPF66715.1 hypothetical protein IP69_14300 [Bosea sp. AAP35]